MSSPKSTGSSGEIRRVNSDLPSTEQARTRVAFTLVELLAVISIMLTLFGLLSLGFAGMKRAGDVANAAQIVADALRNARSYAIANSTYVWVGFLEEGADARRIVVAVAASKDGTRIYNPADLAPVAPLPATRLVPVDKPVRIDGMRLKTFDPGSGTGGDFDSRPAVSGTDAQIGDDASPSSSTPFSFGDNTFSQVIEFSPRGEARISNSAGPLEPVVEVGLGPAQGSADKNDLSVQVTGLAGKVSVYRR